MQVVATRDGFYGKIRKAGDHFPIESEKQLSEKWMAKVGTEKYDDFIRAFKARGGAVQNAERDKITGERISAGGVAEQLAVALEENRRLADRIVELEAENKILTENQQQAPVEPSTPAEAATDDEQKASKPTRVRRRPKPE